MFFVQFRDFMILVSERESLFTLGLFSNKPLLGAFLLTEERVRGGGAL